MSPERDPRIIKPLLARLESSVRIVLDFQQAFNRHDIPAMLALCSGDCRLETASPAPEGTSLKGRDELSRYWQESFQCAPQAQLKIEDIFGLGLHCVMRWRLDQGERGGLERHLRGVDLFQVRDGLICEIFSYVKG
jgi:limonene-1,2-epoxide hydrolase